MAKKKKKEYNQGIVTLDNSGNVTTVKKSQDYKTNYAPKKEVNKPSVGKVLVDSTINAGKTLGNVATNMGKGALKTLEAINDTANNLATKANTGMESLLLGLAGKDKKEIKKLTEAEKKANREYIKSDRTNALLDATGWNEYQKKFEEGSLVKESNLGGQIAQGIGGMVPSLLAGQYLGGVNAAGQSLKGLKGVELAKTAAKNVGTNLMNNAAANAVLGASSYGSGVEEAYQQGATDKQANLYGLGNAALEFGTEMLTGGIPGLENQTGIVDNLVEKGINKATSGITGQIPKAIAKGGLKVGSNMLGEGFEEGLSTLLNPALKNATYADGEKVNWEEVGKSALVGGLTGAFLSGPQDLMTMSNEIRQARQQQLQEVQNQVQSGEITPEQGTQKLEQIEKGTYKENQQLNQIAQQKVEEIQQAVQNGNISNQEAIKEIEAVSQTLSQQREQLNNNLNTQEQQEYNDLQNLPFELDGQELKRLNQLEAKKNNTELYQTINNRENVDLSDRNVKAIQQEHPEVKPFYQDVATDLLNEIEDMGTKASTIYKENEFGENTVTRTKRYIPDSDLREYADSNNITMEKLKDGLSRIIEDNGKENTKVAKEVEQILDKKLQDGYTTVREGKIPPNQDYIDLVSGKVKPNELLNADIETNDEVIVAPNEEAKELTNRINSEIKGEKAFTKVEQDNKAPMRSWVKTSLTETGQVELVNSMDGKKITYEPQSNEKTIKQAEAQLRGLSYEEKIGAIKDFIRSDKRVTAVDIAKIESTIQEALQKGDTKNFMELVEDCAILGTELGQSVQALSIIKNSGPQGQLQTLEKIIQREQSKGNKVYEDVEIKEDLVKQVLNSYNEDGSINQEQYDQAMDNLKQDIANQMKVTGIERLDAWRYLAMLGNPKTHARNIVANMAMQILTKGKNVVGAIGESVVGTGAKLIGKDITRTKTLKTSSKEVTDFSKQAINEVFDTFDKGSKYNESAKGIKRDIEKRRKVLPSIIGAAERLNSKALEWEDVVFNKTTAISATKNFLTANGITTLEQINNHPELVKQAIDYGIQQGREATFKQESKTASAIKNARERLRQGSVGSKLVGLGIDALMPFTSTPINIAKTGIAYTPGIGLIDTLSAYNNAPSNLKGQAVIDSLSKQFVGGTLAAVGYALAKQGLLNGAAGEDKEDKFEKDLGQGDYSITFRGKNYDISWLSPSAMPLLIGAELHNVLRDRDELSFDYVMEVLASTLDPLTSMSFMESVQRTLSSFESGSKAIGSIFGNSFTSYISQYIPTLLSQIASVTDEKQRDTQGDNFIDKTINQVKYKIPGARQTLDTKTNVWGEELDNTQYKNIFNAFLNPMNIKDVKIDDTSKELIRLQKSTETGVPSMTPTSNVSINKENHKFDVKEKKEYKNLKGKTSKEALDALVNSDRYKNADDYDKAKMVNNIYTYSSYEAKKNYANKNDIDLGSSKKAKFEAIDKYDIPVADYFSLNLNDIKSDKDSNGKAISGTKKQKIIDSIYTLNLTKQQRDGLIKDTVYNDSTKKYNMVEKFGIDANVFSDYDVEINKIKSDYNRKGTAIKGSKDRKVKQYINSLPLSSVQKQALYQRYNYQNSIVKKKTTNKQLHDYINNMSISKEEKQELADYIGIN